ncbi:hypothetical protein QQF64_017822 [Cirrhinus molitorella]|uniref:Uncharacterized protein n=2 Tax=Cirrhinus molitorella TaxID=172907 RepID=A0AA88P7V0_9TELE|nr:hypothetical protein Q8A67_022458 [Cirrhinus molitorella]
MKCLKESFSSLFHQKPIGAPFLSGIDCLMPVPCLQVAGEDFERCDRRGRTERWLKLWEQTPLHVPQD